MDSNVSAVELTQRTGWHSFPPPKVENGLVQLYRPVTAEEERVVRNYSHPSQPELQNVQISVDGSPYLPKDEHLNDPSSKTRDHSFITLQLNKAVVAPCLLLTTYFLDNFRVKLNQPFFEPAIEFYFAKLFHQAGPGIQSFRQTHGADAYYVEWDASGFVPSGWTLLENHTAVINQNPANSELLQVMERLMQPGLKRVSLRIPFSWRLSECFLNYLPGGTLEVPKSISQPAYSYYLDEDDDEFVKKYNHPAIAAQSLVSRRTLVEKGFPFIPLHCGPVFSDVTEAAIQLAYAADNEFKEDTTALQLFCGGKHSATFFTIGKVLMAGLNFGKFKRLPGIPEKSPFAIAEGTQLKIIWNRPGAPIDEPDERTAYGVTARNLFEFPGFDDILLIFSGNRLKELAVPYQPGANIRSHQVSLLGYPNMRAYTCEMSTISALCNPFADETWHQLLLNQNYSALPCMDPFSFLTADRQLRKYEQAWERVRYFKTWNDEQLEVLERTKNLVGQVLMIHGPAGTGKTTVLVAIAALYYLSGFSVFFTAPSNAAVDVFVQELAHCFPDIELIRIYPTSRQDRLPRADGTRTPQPEAIPQENSKEELVTLAAVQELKDQYSANKFRLKGRSLQEVVLDIANRPVIAPGDVAPEHWQFRHISGDREHWLALRAFMEAVKEKPVDEWSSQALAQFDDAYKACCVEVISRCRFLASTSAKITTQEVKDGWSSDYWHDSPGLIVLQDEAPMDFEALSWAPVVDGPWSDKVRGWVMAGDHKQLGPTVTSNSGQIQFNEFRDRVEISLFERLMSMGFPHVMLKEQHRMNPIISKFPNMYEYEGKLKDGWITGHKLGAGEAKALFNVLSQGHSLRKMAIASTEAMDTAVRLAHLVITHSKKRKNKFTGSSANMETLRWVSQQIPKLSALYGKETNQKVLILTPYRYQASLYKRELHRLKADGYKTEQLPRVMTVDASQGSQAHMVILDIVLNFAEYQLDFGFQTDRRRANVAFTRAQKVLWIVSGELEGRTRRNRFENPGPRVEEWDVKPPIVEYKRFMEASRTWSFNIPRIPYEEIPESILTEREQDIMGQRKARAALEAARPPLQSSKTVNIIKSAIPNRQRVDIPKGVAAPTGSTSSLSTASTVSEPASEDEETQALQLAQAVHDLDLLEDDYHGSASQVPLPSESDGDASFKSAQTTPLDMVAAQSSLDGTGNQETLAGNSGTSIIDAVNNAMTSLRTNVTERFVFKQGDSA